MKNSPPGRVEVHITLFLPLPAEEHALPKRAMLRIFRSVGETFACSHARGSIIRIIASLAVVCQQVFFVVRNMAESHIPSGSNWKKATKIVLIHRECVDLGFNESVSTLGDARRFAEYLVIDNPV